MGAATIALLGPLTIAGGAVALGPRDRVVLTALATHPGDVVDAERLADALWGEHPPASWNKVVLGCVMRLRRALGSEAIETTTHGYRLTLLADDIDSQRFERQVGRARELLTLGEPERAAFVLSETLALWRGRALADAESWEPARIEAARLDELRLDAEEVRIDACLQSGQHREVLAEAQSLVPQAPLRERRWALLALAQYQAGRQGEALRTLRQARTALATELGVDPGPELVALEQAILRQEPALIADAVRVEASAVCPYRGLLPFDVDDSDGFFGRDLEVDECLRRLTMTNFVAVVGASGSGKSSLVRAGVAAALRRNGRRVTIVTPGARPMDALTPMPAGGGPVLVVDQCEEAVSLCLDPVDQARFFHALADYAERSPVVVAVRADRLGDVSAFPPFARLVERSLCLLGPMGEDDLRAAIEGPAHQAGVLLEAGLVDLLVREVEGESGALPLLSHALRQTWERREGRILTVTGYRATGGIRGAVAQSAESVYERLPPEQRPLLQDLLLRLVGYGGDGTPVRRRVPRRSLAIDANHERLIEVLVSERLVTSDGDSVELAHEALARVWPRLRGWLDDDVEGQRVFGHLVAAAETWDAMGRPESELYRGARLTQATMYEHASHDPAERGLPRADLTPTERQFLDASRGLGRREARAKRVRRSLVVGVAALLVVAAGAGALALRQAERAESASVVADARRAAALSLDADDVELSLLLAVEAVELEDSPDTRASLLAALSRYTALVGSAHTEPLVAVAVSPDGGTVAAGGPLAGTSVVDPDSLIEWGSHDTPPKQIEYRPDGEQIAIAVNVWSATSLERDFAPLPIVLIDTATLEDESVQLGGLPSGKVEGWDIDYSADGRFLAASVDSHDVNELPTTVLVWDVAAPAEPILRFRSPMAWAVALSPDGSLLYVGTHDPAALTVYDVDTGRQVDMVETPQMGTGAVNASDPADVLEVSPDGTTLAVQDVEDVVLLDADTLAELKRLTAHTDWVRTLEFSGDSATLASGANDGEVIVWDVATGAQGEHLDAHNGPVWGLAFDPEGGTLYSASTDRTLLAWDLSGQRPFIPRIAQVEPEARRVVVTAPDGEAAVYVSHGEGDLWGHTLQFLDVGAGRLGEPIATDHGNWVNNWRPPNFDQLATADATGSVYVWDWRSGAAIAQRRVADGAIASVAYSADGSRLVVGERSGLIHQIDADDLTPVGRQIELGSRVRELFPGPDGRAMLVTLDDSTTIAMVDLVNGDVVYEADPGIAVIWADFSFDGSQIAVAAVTGEVGVLDAVTGTWLEPPTVAHDDNALRVSFAPDASQFVTSGFDGRVILWDGRTGDRLATVVLARPGVGAAAEFLADGHTVVVATTDGEVYTWDTTLEHSIEAACAVAGRNLTEDEWQATFGSRPYRETCPVGD